jgi:hypothetical protein
MDPTDDRSPVAGLPAPLDSPSTALDAHGFDPAAYTWVPVRRTPRNDGWSHQRQRDFIEALADCGSVTEAAQRIGMSVSGAYRLRRSPGGEAFAAAWDAAVHQAALHLVDIAFDRAIHGSSEPVFDRDGRCVGRRMRQNDRLLMFLMRAHLPERYAHAHRAERPADAPPVPLVTPVAQALDAMAPVTPNEPHKLMAPDALADALEAADIMAGALPHWLRNRDGPVDAAEVQDDPMPDSLGSDFEAALAQAKHDAKRPSDLDDDDDDDDDMDDALDDESEEEDEDDL